MTNVPRPGWYPDPAGTSEAYRWWDGQSWSEHLSDTPNAPAPTDGDDPPRRRSTVRALVALLVIIALFLGAGAGVGLWLWEVGTGGTRSNTDTGGRTSPPRSPVGSGATEPAGQLDESTRTASIAAASMELPDDPYELQPNPMRVPDVLNPVFSAEAEVHDRYDGEHDWGAVVALAAVDPALAASPDLATAGRAMTAKLVAKLYGRTAQVRKSQVADRSVDGCAGIELSAEIHYAYDRLPSRFDEVHAVMVKLDDGTMVLAVTSVPNDADPELSRLAAKSLDSLTIN